MARYRPRHLRLCDECATGTIPLVVVSVFIVWVINASV